MNGPTGQKLSLLFPQKYHYPDLNHMVRTVNIALRNKCDRSEELKGSPCNGCHVAHCCRQPVSLTQLEALVLHQQVPKMPDNDTLVAAAKYEHDWVARGFCLDRSPGATEPPLCVLHSPTRHCSAYEVRPSVCATYYCPPGFVPHDCRFSEPSKTMVPMMSGGWLTDARTNALMLSQRTLGVYAGLNYQGIASMLRWAWGYAPYPLLTCLDRFDFLSIWWTDDSGASWNKHAIQE
jgi:Fe-S-cluster containining protein